MAGEPVSLTPKEYGILKFLMEHPGQVFSPKQIYSQVWDEVRLWNRGYGSGSYPTSRGRKLEINPDEPRHLKVVWGQGYKIE